MTNLSQKTKSISDQNTPTSSLDWALYVKVQKLEIQIITNSVQILASMAGLSILFSSDVAFFIPAITEVLNARANKAPPTDQAIAGHCYYITHAAA